MGRTPLKAGDGEGVQLSRAISSCQDASAAVGRTRQAELLQQAPLRTRGCQQLQHIPGLLQQIAQ